MEERNAESTLSDVTESKLLDCCRTAFLDADAVPEEPGYRTRFVSNDIASRSYVRTMIEDELADCESFAISVAFVTNSGLKQLLYVLKELAEKGTPGRILTADYLCFSEPIALRRLLGLKNIPVHLFRCPSAVGFHPKENK